MYNDTYTDRQKSFIADLTAKRNITPAMQASIDFFNSAPVNQTRANASQLIERLLTMTVKPRVVAPAPARPGYVEDPRNAEVRELLKALPASRYALKAEQIELGAPGIRLNGNDLLFVEVHEHRRTKQRRLFRVHGAPGRFSRSYIGNTDEKLLVLRTLLEAPNEAALRFADHYQCCARCSAELTDIESRRLGLGPTCVKYFPGLAK